jgi:ABC-type phosphate transport system substrate-binding protein
MSLRKQPLACRVGLTAALSVLGCLAFTGVSQAAAPTGGGNNCVQKIDGRGSTLQNNLQQNVWGPGYQHDVCGPVAPLASGDNSGQTMVAYNYPSAVSLSLTGSGAGITGAECRTDAFDGTDTPYLTSQYNTLQAGGETSTSSTCSGVQSLAPPYAPTGPFPASTDTTTATPVMSFPVAAASVVLVVNLNGVTGCPTSGLKFTGAQISQLMGGDISNWDSSVLTTNNPSLATCNEPVTRVVREDNSGTTNIFKNYLENADPTRSSSSGACEGDNGTVETLQPWSFYNTSPNNVWPGGHATSGGFVSNPLDGTCSPAVNAASSGGPALFTLLQNTVGGVGYLDLADYKNTSENPNNVPIEAPLVQNGAGTGYQAASSGLGANCNLSALTEPDDNTPTGVVGLDSSWTWAEDNEAVNGTGNSNNGTDAGTAYPICGLTWQLVYTGLDGTAGTGAVSTLTNDQRQTLYSYITYELSSVGQAYLSKNNYAPLPSSWLPNLLSGFQGNF